MIDHFDFFKKKNISEPVITSCVYFVFAGMYGDRSLLRKGRKNGGIKKTLIAHEHFKTGKGVGR